MVDNITIFIFSLEYIIRGNIFVNIFIADIVRITCSTRKIKFFLQPMNLVDLFSLVSVYIYFAFSYLEEYEISCKAGKIVRLKKVMQIFRIYKLFQHFDGIQSILYNLWEPLKGICLLTVIIGESK